MALSREYLDRLLFKSYTKARKGKLGTVDEYKFEMNAIDNLVQLREDILHFRYKPSRGTAFINHEPVEREIFAARFRDRIVHHLIYELIAGWWDRRLIFASYSCRENKGTDAGIKDLYHKMQRVSRNFQRETVVVKIDISSYFCSIKRKKLYKRVIWGLDQQFLQPATGFLRTRRRGRGETETERRHNKDLFRMLKFLCGRVIFDNPVKGVQRKGKKSDWDDYPARKSLFCQKPGVGIVIGNLTSQMFSNIFLDQLDRLVVITLGIKNYGRYVDDAFFVLPADELEDFKKHKMPMIQDLLYGMGLVMNPKKTFCQNIKHGVPFLGAIVFPHHVRPGKRLIRNFRKAVRAVQSGQEDPEVLVSFLGRMQHFDCENLIEKTFREFGMDYNRSQWGWAGSKYYTDPKGYANEKFWKK